MDPFEEFEFKPLTEGLGFQNNKKTASPVPAPLERGLPKRDLDFLEVEEPSQSPFTQPLPRPRTPPSTPQQTPVSPTPVDDILVSLKRHRRLEKEEDTRQRKELRQARPQETWKPTFSKWSPMILDGMLITAASLLCMIITLFTTRVDLLANLANPDTEGMIYLATASLVLGVTFIYMVVNRVFMGFTPGEWAYDMRLGTPEQLGTTSYAFKAIARQLLLLATGLLPLPLVSSVLGKDFAGRATGLQLHRKA